MLLLSLARQTFVVWSLESLSPPASPLHATNQTVRNPSHTSNHPEDKPSTMKWNPISNVLKEMARDRRRAPLSEILAARRHDALPVLAAFTLVLASLPPGQAQEMATPPASPDSQTELDGTQQNKPDPDAAKLEDVVVSGGQSTPRTVAADAAATQLAEVPGGASVVSAQDVERARASSTADVLNGQPGVFAQQAGGNDSIKISIRGSGINRGTGFFRSGVKFTYDGLPITGPSGTPFELFEPLGLQYTEVLRGANAFDRGALTLGGAINFVTNTGYEAFPVQARFEAGSFGYFKGQLSSGVVSGPFDYYISLTSSTRLGYQDHSNSNAARVTANFGYKITAKLDTRFYFHFGWVEFQQPGTLTRGQIRADPTQANTTNARLNAGRLQPGSELIGNKTTLSIDDHSTLELGLVYQNFPIYIQGGVAPSSWNYGNIAAQLKYTRTDTLFGHTSNTTAAVYSSTDIYGTVDRHAGLAGTNNYAVASAPPLLLSKGQLITRNDFAGSSDNVLLLTNDTELLPRLWLTTGIAGIYIRRDIDITFPVHVGYKSNDFDYQPRVGLRYNFTPNFQLYGNFSRSVEPRNDWAGVNTPQTAPGYFVRDIVPQTAWTGEVGGRLKLGIFELNASYYRTQLKHEILTVIPDPTVNIAVETNADRTIHQGVELGLDTTLWQWGGGPAAAGPVQDGTGGKNPVEALAAAPRKPQRLLLHQAYTWSDFHYDDDRKFGDNRLPGIPDHFYQAELRYEHPLGFYASFNVQIASSYDVDYANSFATASYAIFGASVGYLNPKKGWQAFVDVRNLTDKHYAADVSPGYNDLGRDIARSDPGDGFGVFGGISFAY